MRRVLLSVCLCLGLTLSANASGFSIYEASARANAMLGAFTAYANHVSTIYYNPAGLSELKGIHVSAGATLIAPRSKFRGPLPYSNQEYKQEAQNFPIPNFYASYQITDGLTAGVGVYVPYGLGTKWDQDWPGRFLAIETAVETIFVNPAIAYTLPDFGIGKIQIGGGVMIASYGTVTLKRAVGDFVPESNFELDGKLDKPAFGYNLGLLYTPVEDVTLGFTYRSKVSVDFTGDANFNELPEYAFPPNTEGGTTLNFPANWSAGVRYRATDNLSMELDYVWWGWSSYDELVIKFDQELPALGSDQLASDRAYNDTYQIRFGAEYKELFIPELTGMIGFAYDQNPIPDRTLDPTLPDADRLLFSGGITYAINDMIDVDLSYIFIRAEQRKNTTAEHGFSGVYNTYAHLPAFGISLKF
jgi:long-chain fatty acid transport protein